MPQPLLSRHSADGLERFLFADICSQTNGPPLTVLSMLARAGLDPWAEAKRLSQMPKPEAVVCFASDINRVSTDHPADGENTDLARTRVSKLPGPANAKPIDVSFAGNGHAGIPVIAAMMAFFSFITVFVLAILLHHG